MSLRWDSDNSDSQLASYSAIWVSDTFSDLHSMKNKLFCDAFILSILNIIILKVHLSISSEHSILLISTQIVIRVH